MRVNEWVESDVTQFVDYLNYIRYKDQNANKQRMKIVEIKKVLGHDATALQKSQNDFDSINSIINLIDAIGIDKYIDSKKVSQFNELLNELLEKIKITYSNNFDKKISIIYTNDAVKKIKAIVEKKTETKTIPDSTGFTQFAKNHFSLEIKMKQILDGFKFEFISEPEYVGKLEEGKLLCKKTLVTMLNDNSKSDDGFMGITNLREMKLILKSINSNIYNYVSDVLVSRLNDLAKMKKVVIVATHNANVAVRTMPYRSILKVYDNGEYKTYIGNPYTNKLTNIKDNTDQKDWKAESIRILEGGKEAFDERSDIYA